MEDEYDKLTDASSDLCATSSTYLYGAVSSNVSMSVVIYGPADCLILRSPKELNP